MAPHHAAMDGTSAVSSANYWTLSLVFGLVVLAILLLCIKKKKQNSITMIRYIQNEELEVIERSSMRTTTENGNGTFEKQKEQRISQYSTGNENRDLPGIPENAESGIHSGTPPLQLAGETTQTNSTSTTKESRRLPALPLAGQHDAQPHGDESQEKQLFDATYEDLQDEIDQIEPLSEAVGSADSALYSKVSDALQKCDDDDDMYARVGGGDSSEKPQAPGNQQNADKARSGSTSSDDDPNMNSPTAVTYASIDKMKKTMSVKKKKENASNGHPPPVPDRNFDEEDEGSGSEVCPPLPPPFVEDEAPTSTSDREDANESEEHAFYATVTVRESFAHQRLRQMVEEEQMNRYVNTSPGQQNDDESSEPFYENVSVSGSADGSVGPASGQMVGNVEVYPPSPRGYGYATIGEGQTGPNLPTPPPEMLIPEYENLNPI